MGGRCTRQHVPRATSARSSPRSNRRTNSHLPGGEGVAHTLTFSLKHNYDSTKTGITVPVELSNGSNIVQVDARLDTGASFCIFERTYAEMLGLSVESGSEAFVSTANGTFQVFGHWMT